MRQMNQRFRETSPRMRKMKEARCVMVGLQMDANGKELIDRAINRLAEEGDRIVAVNVCRDSDLKNNTTTLSLLSILEDYLAPYEEVCNLKNITLVGRVARGNSIRKALVKEAKLCAASKVVVGVNKHITVGGPALVAKYCAKKLQTTSLIAVQNGKVVFEKEAIKSSPEELKPRSLGKTIEPNISMQFVVARNSEANADPKSMKSFDSGVEDDSKNEAIFDSRFEDDKKEAILHDEARVGTPRSLTAVVRQLPEPDLGWPLLQNAVNQKIESKKAKRERKLSVVQWVMALPDRNMSIEQPLSQLTKELSAILSKNKSSCRWFQFNELLSSTNHFSSDNLIGKGGTGQVYKGCLDNGQQVAIKLSKLSAESSRDFLLEVDIITKMDHSNIVSLIGLCVKENTLISLYNYFHKGSLEENLQGQNDKHPLTWDMRFKVATGIAEALSYLHHGCSESVIHRDVKSSNILLNDQFEPQLSDFGLAMNAPKTSSYLAQNDIAGTFGYLAPEYFMYGKVSNKMDVYAFGVILLELLTGRKPIDDENPKGEESLVMWATRILEKGDLVDLLDPNLGAKYDRDQMRRMILAASLCITRIVRLRPGILKICSLLQGEEDMESWICSQADCMLEAVDCPDDEANPASSAGSHLSLALLDIDDNTSVTSYEQNYLGSWEEYLRGRWSRSSSFN